MKNPKITEPTAVPTLTRYFAVTFGGNPTHNACPVPPMPAASDFRPWVNCLRNDPVLVPLVGHRAIRDRGGLGGEAISLTVYETAPMGTPFTKAKELITHAFNIFPN